MIIILLIWNILLTAFLIFVIYRTKIIPLPYIAIDSDGIWFKLRRKYITQGYCFFVWPWIWLKDKQQNK
jgi:hypothetical protein